MKRYNEGHLPKRERGFSLVAAIFVLVVLSMLGAFMVTIGQTQRSTTVGAVMGARAYQAASAGIEYGIFQASNPPFDSTCGDTPSTPTTTLPFDINVPGLAGFRVTVVCSYTVHQERSATYNVFLITATAETVGGADYFSRSLVVTVTDAP